MLRRRAHCVLHLVSPCYCIITAFSVNVGAGPISIMASRRGAEGNKYFIGYRVPYRHHFLFYARVFALVLPI